MMNRRVAYLATLLFAAMPLAARSEDSKDDTKWPPSVSKEEDGKFVAAITKLKASTPAKEFDGAIETLRRGGMKAFPALLAARGNSTKTDVGRDARMEYSDGTVEDPYYETVGDVCWGIFEEQVEGGDPWDSKGNDVFQDFYVLKQDSVRKWLDSHKGATLQMLRLAARREQLKLAESRLAKDPHDARTIAAVAFFKSVLKELEAEQRQEIRVAIGSVTAIFRLIPPKAEGLDYPEFYMLETEVTNEQYKQFLTDTKRTKDDTEVLEIVKKRHASGKFSTGDVPYSVEDPASIWKNGQFPRGQASFPVSLVTLHDARDFCKWLSTKYPKLGLFRLPTWNEWMIAAYGGDRDYPWGDKWDNSKVHMSYGYEFPKEPKRTEDVKARPAGKTPQGLFGMLGNVAEFIDETDPTNKDYFHLEARWMGGGFTEGVSFLDKSDARVPPRQDYWGYSHHASLRECDLGFRVLLDPSKNLNLLSRPRLFNQRNKAWSGEERK